MSPRQRRSMRPARRKSRRPNEDILTATVSGAAGGVGVAGAVGVKVVVVRHRGLHRQEYEGQPDGKWCCAGRQGQCVTDNVTWGGGVYAGRRGLWPGVGATAEINIVRNTTTAYLGDSVTVNADRDLSVSANSTKDVQAAVAARASAVMPAFRVPSRLGIIGKSYQTGQRFAGWHRQYPRVAPDSTMKTDNVTGNMGDSPASAATKSDIHARTSGLSVSGDLNESSTSSLDKTRAYVGSNAQIVTGGGKVTVSATDRTQLDLHAVGAAAALLVSGGAIGIGITNSTTEAFIGTSSTVDADGDVTVSGQAGNVNATGWKVLSAAVRRRCRCQRGRGRTRRHQHDEGLSRQQRRCPGRCKAEGVRQGQAQVRD